MFISSAWAQAVEGVAGGGGLMAGLGQFLPLVLIVVVIYFFMIRPQTRKAKEHRAMIAALKRGDRILTNGGLIGQVSKLVDDHEIQVEIAEGVKVRVQRGAVAQVLTRTQADGKKE